MSHGRMALQKDSCKRPLEMLFCVCSKAILHKIASSLIGEAVLKYDMVTQSKKNRSQKGACDVKGGIAWGNYKVPSLEQGFLTEIKIQS